MDTWARRVPGPVFPRGKNNVSSNLVNEILGRGQAEVIHRFTWSEDISSRDPNEFMAEIKKV